MKEINNFQQEPDEALYQAWEHFKELLMKCPQHYLTEMQEERGFGSLPSSTETNPRDQVKSISTNIEADSNSIRRIGSNQYAVSTGQKSTLLYKLRQTTVPFPSRLDNHYCEEEGNYRPKFTEAYGASHINNAIPRKEKDLGSFTLPCFINDFCFDNALITLRIGEEMIIFKSVKPTSSLINRVYMLSLRERMKLDLEARLMGDTLVINRSLDPLNRDYIKLNNLNKLVELRINQGDDLMPTIEEGEVIEEFKTRDHELDARIDNYPSYCDYDKNIHKDCAHNLKSFNECVYFCWNLFCCDGFAVLEDMDAYRDKGMGDVIFGEPFLSEVGIKARRFDGMITIYNGNESVTYQMVRSHPKFKHQTNKQCNKIPPLLKVSNEDKKNVISHPYQKLKGFYKGVLNLGPDYIRDAKTEIKNQVVSVGWDPDNHPPMLVESDYESWKIRIERYIRGKTLGKLIWRSIQNGPTPHPQITMTEGQGDDAVQVTRDKRDEEFTEIKEQQRIN
ncbi:hypothetical protein Tco_1499602 [Tanacetum coccineum]